MKIHDYLCVSILVLGGCTSLRTEGLENTHDELASPKSICDVSEKNSQIGMKVHINATYETDRSHYAYLVNEGCGESGVLDVHDFEPIVEASVREFYAAIDRRCEELETPYLCVIEANVDVEIELVNDSRGRLAAKLLEVGKFSFVESEPVKEN